MQTEQQHWVRKKCRLNCAAAMRKHDVILIPSVPCVPAALRQEWLTRRAGDVMPHLAA
jgi:hypothetical protein